MKKWFVVLLCLIAITGVWAAGQEEGAVEGSADLVNKVGFPIVNEPITLNAVAIQQTWSRDWNEMPKHTSRPLVSTPLLFSTSIIPGK